MLIILELLWCHNGCKIPEIISLEVFIFEIYQD